jgi:predicted lipoprotein with Yx(FWY)xxD motif
LIALVAFAGCGSDDDGSQADRGAAGARTTQAANATGTGEPASTTANRRARKGTRVILAGSDFGRMLFNSNRQAIYIFQRDRRNKSNCYGECARAWPPVFTKGRPRAGRGVDRSLLGTVRRRGGRLQVTYDGKPLYYYVNEGPGEVKCHNVYLNGGLWWAVGADGKRLQ